MPLFCQNVHKQDRKCRFSKRLIENNAFAIFMSNENFGSTSWYHDGTTMVLRWYHDGNSAPNFNSPCYIMSDEMMRCHQIDDPAL